MAPFTHFTLRQQNHRRVAFFSSVIDVSVCAIAIIQNQFWYCRFLVYVSVPPHRCFFLFAMAPDSFVIIYSFPFFITIRLCHCHLYTKLNLTDFPLHCDGVFEPSRNIYTHIVYSLLVFSISSFHFYRIGNDRAFW